MLIPKPPTLSQLKHITPSIYEAGLSCLAKAAWYALGARGVLPEHPAAILGMSFHTVVAAAHRGELVASNDYDRAAARRLFDETARELYSRTHPLVRLKFLLPERLPYYNLHRERAVQLASRIAASRSQSNSSVRASTAPQTPPPQTERLLSSVDRVIVGRPDYLDVDMQTVYDYKSGHIADPEGHTVSDSEARQLRLYAYLAINNGIQISQGVIVRSDGRRSQLQISSADAEAEANKARTQLRALNTAIKDGATFSGLATPSPHNCCSCPCIPFCESFWTSVTPEWHSNCGLNIDGRVLQTETRHIQGISLTALLIAVQSGTVSSQQVSVEQIPSEWMSLNGSTSPQPGNSVRIVQGRVASTDELMTVIRIDKTMTAVWRVPRDAATRSG